MDRHLKSIHLLLFGIFVATAFFPTSAPAEQGDKELGEMSLEELLDVPVVTASRMMQKSSEAPATVYVFTEDTIRNRGYQNLEDLLEDVPEVEIQRKSHHETWNNITIRGISGNEKFIVMLDGVRVSSPTGDHHYVGTNFPLANAKRVEVILGPASALYGVDAFSGIVNIITRSGDELKGGKVAGSYGRFGTTDDSFVWGSTFKNLSLAATGQIYHSDEPFLPDFYPKEYAWYTTQYLTKGLVRVSPFLPPNVVLQLPIQPYGAPANSNFLHFRFNTGDFEFGYMRNYENHNNSVSTRPEFAIYSKPVLWGVSLDSLYAKYTFVSPEQRWKLQTTLSRAAHTLDTNSKFINTFSGYNEAFKYSFGKALKFEEQITYAPDEKNSLIGGFSYEDLDALPKTSDLPFEFDRDLAADVQGFYYLGTNVTDVNGKSLAIFQDFFNVEYQNFGAFLQFQTKEFKKLDITLGSRYDYNTRYGSSFNPRLGLVFSPTSKFKAKLLYGTSFLAPSPYKAYEHFGSFFPQTDSSGNITGLTSLFWRVPNPDLKPERLRALEGAFSYYLTSNVAVSLDVYFNRTRDLIVQEDTPKQYFKGILVADVQTLVNRGEANANGGTIRLDSLWKPGGVSVNWYGSYSLSEGDESGKVLPLSARHTVKAGFDLTYKNLSLSPRLIYRSETFHPRKDKSGNNISNEAFTLVNLFARYSNLFNTSSLRNSIFLRITNLTNTRYFNVRLGGAPASEFLATPQDPLRVTLGFTSDF